MLFSIISCEKRDFKSVAKVETKKISEIMATTVKATGDIIDLGDGITDHGHIWGFVSKLSISDYVTHLGAALKTGAYTSELKNLVPGKTYYTRAYAKIKDEVIYGDTIKFTTMGPPILTTTAATTITSSSATIGGNVFADGGAPVTDRGVYWRAYNNTDTTWIKFQMGEGIGLFSNSLSGLSPNTLYYFKAYATNSVSTTFGAKLSFTTILGAPTNVSAQAGNEQATISFTAPANNGGSAITGYTVTSSPGGFTSTGTSSPITVIGLTNGTAYTFTVVATNVNGPGSESSASNSVTPTNPLTNGLVAYYPFNDNANDESGNSNNGTVNGATPSTDRNGASNSAYSFNGTSNYIVVQNSLTLQLTSSASFNVWVSVPSGLNYPASTSPHILSKGATYGAFYADYSVQLVSPDGTEGFESNSGNTNSYNLVQATSILGKTSWHMITIVYQSGQVKFYTDGTLTDTKTTSTSSFRVSNFPLYIGVRYSADVYTGGFTGKMDDIRIYNRVLTDQEISALYNE